MPVLMSAFPRVYPLCMLTPFGVIDKRHLQKYSKNLLHLSAFVRIGPYPILLCVDVFYG